MRIFNKVWDLVFGLALTGLGFASIYHGVLTPYPADLPYFGAFLVLTDHGFERLRKVFAL